ncbi:MAG: GNAT family N-acetyltransferase [Actinobacteria bacterium]|nr:GNAT family N-acetyltransferase [Actinomycetota bacterium]
MRKSTPKDAAVVAALYLSARKASLGSIPPVVGSDQEVLSWFASRINQGDECWVTEDSSGITSMMLLEPGWIDQLYIRPDKVGNGIGSLLVQRAKELMPTGIKLWTFQSNVRAQNFYERHGFVAIEKTDGQNNQERSPDICYEWKP